MKLSELKTGFTLNSGKTEPLHFERVPVNNGKAFIFVTNLQPIKGSQEGTPLIKAEDD